MAKLSTGASYGGTNRQTSQRLVGAAEQTAIGGELARQAIQPAAIQPMAAPVNTFQQVGAPTLGGPVKFFAPPDLPGPTQDLANLAKSLGGFSDTLGQVGEFLIQKQKADMEKADMVGYQAAMSLSAAFPGQQYAQVRDSLYRQAAAGDLDARQKYEYLQALNPMQRDFTKRNLSRLLMRQAIDSAPGKFADLSTVPGPDGKPVPMELLDPGTPMYQAAKLGLLPVIDDIVVAKEFEPQVAALNTRLDAAQYRIRAQYKENQALQTLSATVSAAMAATSKEDGLALLNQASQQLRQTMGPEVYQKAMEAMPGFFRASAELMQRQGGVNVALASQLAEKQDFFAQNMITGANGETLIQRLGAKGGDVFRAAVVSSQMQALRESQGDEKLTAGIQGEDIAEQVFAEVGAGEPGLTPAERDRRSALVMQRITASVPVGPLQSAALSRASDLARSYDETYSKPARDEANRQVAAITDSTQPPEVKLQMLDQLIAGGFVDPEKAQVARNRVERERTELQSPDGRAREEMIKAEQTKLTKYLQTGGLSTQEQLQIVTYGAELRKEVARIVSDGNNQRLSSEQINERVKKFLADQSADLQSRIERSTGVNRQPLITDIGKYYNDRGLARGGRPPMGPQLRDAVDNAVVMPKSDYDKALNDYALNNTMDPRIQQIIKDSGYAGNAGDFFLKQWKKVYPGLDFPEKYRERMNDLNGQRLSFTAPAARSSGFGMVTPGAAFGTDLGAIVRRSVNQGINALIGGASAATREPTTAFGPTNSNGFVNPVPGVNLASNKGGYASDTGLDIHGPEGSDVVAALPGRIVYAERGHSAQMGQSSSSRGYRDQHSVLVQLDQPLMVNGKQINFAWYSHLQALDPAVAGRNGARIQAGQRLGAMGIANGVSHLHIGLVGDREQKVFLNHREIKQLFSGTTSTPRATTRAGGGMTGYSTYYTGKGGSDGVAGGPTANGERFDPRKMTAAVQWSLRGKYMNKWLIVEDLNTGKSVRVWANDTGQMGGSESRVSREDPRIIDLSPAAFTALAGGLRAGKMRIRVRIDKNQRRN